MRIKLHVEETIKFTHIIEFDGEKEVSNEMIHEAEVNASMWGIDEVKETLQDNGFEIVDCLIDDSGEICGVEMVDIQVVKEDK